MNTPLPSFFKNTIFSTQNKEFIQNSVFNFSILREKENRDYEIKSNNSVKEENNGRMSNSESSNSINEYKKKCFIDFENLKTNFTMKSVNYDLHAPFTKKDSNKSSLNTVKKNLIPNLNDNDLKCFLYTESKPSARSKYNEILSDKKIINNLEFINERKQSIELNEKLDYILNSKKKKKFDNSDKLLNKKRKSGKC